MDCVLSQTTKKHSHTFTHLKQTPSKASFAASCCFHVKHFGYIGEVAFRKTFDAELVLSDKGSIFHDDVTAVVQIKVCGWCRTASCTSCWLYFFFYATIVKNESGANATQMWCSPYKSPHHYLDILVVSHLPLNCALHHKPPSLCVVLYRLVPPPFGNTWSGSEHDPTFLAGEPHKRSGCSMRQTLFFFFWKVSFRSSRFCNSFVSWPKPSNAAIEMWKLCKLLTPQPQESTPLPPFLSQQ